MSARTLPDDERRDCKVQARFTAEQYAAIQAMASERGITPAALAYEVMLEAIGIDDTARRPAPYRRRERQEGSDAPQAD